MNVPDDLRYSADHEWVRVEGDARPRRHHRLRAGRARRRRLRRPARQSGATVEAGGQLGEVESTKSVSEIYAPVAGDGGRRSTTRLADAPGAAQPGSLRRGVDLRAGARAGRRRRDACSTPLRTATSPRTEPIRAGRSAHQGSRAVGWGTVDGVFCHNCGHRNPEGVNFCSSCGQRCCWQTATTPPITLHPVDDAEADGRGRRCHPGRGAARRRRARRQARPERRGPATCSGETVARAGRHPESDIFLDDITVSRRHAEITPSRRRHVRAARRRLAERDLREPRADRRGAARTGDEVQIGKFKLVYLRGGRTSEQPHLPVDRRRPDAAARGVPRRHHLEDPLPREPGPGQPGAHAVGLPQVLRPRRRAPALGAAPAARALPAAQGDQGPPGRRRAGRSRGVDAGRNGKLARGRRSPGDRRRSTGARQTADDEGDGADPGRRLAPDGAAPEAAPAAAARPCMPSTVASAPATTQIADSRRCRRAAARCDRAPSVDTGSDRGRAEPRRRRLTAGAR